MISLATADKKIPKKDVAMGVGASVLVHTLVFSSAFIWALVMPHKTIKPPFCTVNLVSIKDLSSGVSEPKGSPKAAEDVRTSKETPNPGKSRHKSESVAPVKRLAVDESYERPEPQIKKIEPKEAPVITEKPQNLDKEIEKNLDKLIAKPHTTPHTSTAAAQQDEPKHSAAAPPSPVKTAAKSSPGNERTARGTPTGTAEGGARGTSTGSVFGAPDGSGAILAAAQLYYERVKNAIRQEFKLPDQNVAGLETSAVIVVSKNGQVLSLQIERPSGNGLLDAAAVRAIQNANIPAMPPIMERQQQDFRIKFNARGVS